MQAEDLHLHPGDLDLKDHFVFDDALGITAESSPLELVFLGEKQQFVAGDNLSPENSLVASREPEEGAFSGSVLIQDAGKLSGRFNHEYGRKQRSARDMAWYPEFVFLDLLDANRLGSGVIHVDDMVQMPHISSLRIAFGHFLWRQEDTGEIDRRYVE